MERRTLLPDVKPPPIHNRCGRQGCDYVFHYELQGGENPFEVLRDMVATHRPHCVALKARGCLQHRSIRSRDTFNIVERPERLRAVTIGLSAAISRLAGFTVSSKTSVEPDELAAQLGRLNIESSSASPPQKAAAELPVSIVRSAASVDILKHPAVKYVHRDINGDVYLENLACWTKESKEKIEKGESEIPEHLSQGDLYLCPESLTAMQGAVGTVCEAVDSVASSSQPAISPAPRTKRAFSVIRPPGHHCGEDTPSGCCFVNNVAIGAAHAHLQHGINRVVIFDIDLHHGNGTQSIVWQMNEETYRQTLETEGGAPSPAKPGPQVYYGSIHDILSYPCEDGKAALVQAASVSIHGAHGQHIENVHLETYTSPEHLEVLYKERYSRILRRAEDFLDKTGEPGEDVLVFIRFLFCFCVDEKLILVNSCGMDASEHEMPSMSRHNRRVPTSFYHRFTRDACVLADRYAGGKLISVLEGGYSDRALMSGAMAHLVGLSESDVKEDALEEWWNKENLDLLEKATKKRRGGRPSVIFTSLDLGPAAYATSSSTRAPIAPSSRTLRERKKPGSTSVSAASSPKAVAGKNGKGLKTTRLGVGKKVESDGSSSLSSELSEEDSEEEAEVTKKLPRVILKLGPQPGLGVS
ncbi:Arginase/deacetylase [Roridomyces roridus]|uniref:Arginase/deacetylase n=1 Tax=Roridomyces roridus TaxID=1738132 RepID=A0AAD7FGJ9_9AGAR|nr:Arginase/deacetylase [Roridomyces roridus]